MNIRVNDFHWEPGKNDAEYIKLLESSRDEWQKLAQKAIAKLKAQESVKHGRWVRVSGYVTPGGDPVWKCSECGKGVHVYGIEASTYQGDVSDQQWVSCPNCGADMREVEKNGEGRENDLYVR